MCNATLLSSSFICFRQPQYVRVTARLNFLPPPPADIFLLQLASVRMWNDDSYVTLLLCYLLQATVYGSLSDFCCYISETKLSKYVLWLDRSLNNSNILSHTGLFLAEWLERLTVNAKVATVLGPISASSDTVESEGRQMKQCWIKNINIQNISLLNIFSYM
jgi:hypothetical protein